MEPTTIEPSVVNDNQVENLPPQRMLLVPYDSSQGSMEIKQTQLMSNLGGSLTLTPIFEEEKNHDSILNLNNLSQITQVVHDIVQDLDNQTTTMNPHPTQETNPEVIAFIELTKMLSTPAQNNTIFESLFSMA